MSEPDLVLLLRLDQRQRWQQGECLRVEAYLEKHPALRDDPEGLLDLIYQEVVLRAGEGGQPQLEEYVQRFPELAAQLRVQFEIYHVIQGPPLTQINPAQNLAPAAADRTNGPGAAPKGAFADDYEILEEIGRGGMGVVYRARQTSLKRLAALKMILAGSRASTRDRERFRTEAEAAARLHHPNIVGIYEVGEHDGCLFLALELVDGPSLEQKCAETPQPARLAAELVETLARAMHAAHERGIIHRDLKPANVLLTAEGTPKITDFGLARLLDAERGPASSASLLGTPQYMAPEQAVGPGRNVGPRADVYALGGILYQLLTGRPPFLGETLVEVLEQVRSRNPIPPRRLQRNVPRELETICLKCLEKDPGRRYTSARDLAEDLRRCLAGEPIQARPMAAWRRVLKWVRRRPAAAALAAVSVAALLTLAGFGYWHDADVRTTAERARASGRQDVEQGRSRYRQFLQRRDDAFFYGTYGTVFTDSDLAVNRKATREAAEAALALVGTAVDSQAMPILDPLWSESEKTEVQAGCCQLLLILAELAARASPEQSPGEQARRAREALTLLDRAAQMAPPTPAYHLRRARFLNQLGEKEKAQQESNRAAQLRPARMIDFFLLGEERYRQGRPEEARRDFQNALQFHPGDFWSRYFLALCSLKQRLPDEAEAHLTECIRQRPGFVWTHLLRGFTREKRGAFKAAEADYQTVLQLDPNADAAYCLHVNRGRMRLQQEQFDVAIADLARAVALKPGQDEAYRTLARVYLKQKRFGEAVKQLDQAIRLQPSAPRQADSHAERGYALFLGGRCEEALEACDRALTLRPGAPAVWALRARVLLELRRYDASVKAYNRYLADGGPAVADVYRGRGLAHMKLHHYLNAVDDYSRALELQPRADLYAHRGWAYFFADAWKPALRDFQEALRRNPDDTDARIGMGLARVLLGQYREAVGDARTALRRKPTTPEMMHNIACTLALAAARAEQDSTREDRLILAVAYREEGVAVVRQTLSLVPSAQRVSFWREKILPDPALDSIRNCPGFQRLLKEYGEGKRARQVVPE